MAKSPMSPNRKFHIKLRKKVCCDMVSKCSPWSTDTIGVLKFSLFPKKSNNVLASIYVTRRLLFLERHWEIQITIEISIQSGGADVAFFKTRSLKSEWPKLSESARKSQIASIFIEVQADYWSVRLNRF